MTQKPRLLRTVLTAIALAWLLACGALRGARLPSLHFPTPVTRARLLK